MKKFENVIITKASLTNEEIESLKINITKIVNVYDIEDKGIKTLAYTVKGETQGHFIIFYLRENKENIEQLEKYYRLNDNILKFITIKIED